MVAAAKLRRAQDAITAARPFARQLEKILRNLAMAESDFVHPYFEARASVQHIVIAVLSSDRGLCGAFNANLFRAVQHRIDKLQAQYPGAEIKIVAVGRKSVAQFSKMSHEVIASHPDAFFKLEYSTATSIADHASDVFLTHRADIIELIYNEFVSVIKQEVKILPLLPIIPAAQKTEHSGSAVDYIFEPTRADILESLLPKYLHTQVWRALLDSNAAEQAARMVAMENATTNARDLISSLQLIYNRERQAVITKEMLEIVGGAEALVAH
ncbi:MAG: ATP synthase gamma chain [Chlorobi bacterium]|nr:MAG: F0F1 ATP synthase subunit gamma [Chlorobi bacterium OLB6]MBV6462650.1 ATP synthase gamma chain [Chlorobiota bacterium]